MAIEFTCAKCTNRLSVSDELGGRQCRCPSCEAVCDVPEKPIATRPPAAQPPAAQASLRKAASPSTSKLLKIICSGCKQAMQVPSAAIGVKVACPACGTLVLIENPTAPTNQPATNQPAKQPTNSLANPATNPKPVPNPAVSKPAAPKVLSAIPVAPKVPNAIPVAPAVSQPKILDAIPVRPAQPRAAAPASRPSPQTASRPAPQAVPRPSSNRRTQQSGLSGGVWDGVPTTAQRNSAGGLSHAARPQGAHRQSLDYPTHNRRRGLTFGNAVGLAMETSFPNCIATSCVITGLYILAILLTQVNLYMFGISTDGLRANDIDVTLPFTFFLTLSAVLGLTFSTLIFGTTSNAALKTVRRHRKSVSHVFSMGGSFGGMLGLQIIYAAAYIAMWGGFMLLGWAFPGDGQVIAAAFMIVISLLLSLVAVLVSFAPMAVVDGEDPVSAMVTSMRIYFDHPICFAIMLVAGMGTGLAVIGTCLVGFLFIGAFPCYVAAACYHLATQNEP